jgi:hypothetical protein
MAHTITESPIFEPTIVVPDGTDPPARAAAITLVAQRLANRTRSLKAVTDQAAVKNASNTFTQPNTFTATLTAAAITASGAITANGGIGAADGNLEITASVSATGGVSAPAVTVTSSNLTLGNAGGDIVYTTQPFRFVGIPMCDGKPLAPQTKYDSTYDYWHTSPGTSPGGVRFSLAGILPRGASNTAVDVIWAAENVAAANVLRLMRSTQPHWTAGLSTVMDAVEPEMISEYEQTVFTPAIGIAAAFERLGAFLPIAYTINNQLDAYFIDVVIPDGFRNQLYGLRIAFGDPGARNG